MKAIILFILFTMLTIPSVFGQIKIGDNPQNIDPASVLELESSTKVLVITRVNSIEMEAITPQRGGIVYNTDTECINYYDGTQWINLCDAVNFTITNDPIINNRATIAITQTESGYNLEIAKNGILGDNIVDGGIGPDDIQDNSITQDKLAAESVGSSEIRQNAVGSDEIRDGSIVPTDMANFIPGQVLSTDENGIVQWGEADDVFDLTFSKLDTTLSITRSTIPGSSVISLASLIGSDDQVLTFTADNKLQIENGNEIDLSTLNNSGTDNQTLTLINDNLAISGGNNISLNNYLDNTDNQTLSINNRRINLTNGGFVDLPAGTVNTDNQNLSITANNLNISGGTGVSLIPYLDNTDAQAISINPAGTQISLTNGGTINLPAAGAEVDGIIGNEILNATDGTLVRAGAGTTANPYTLDVAPTAIGTAELTNNAVTNAKLANNSVQSVNIVNGTIATVDIAPAAASPANTQVLTTSTTGVVNWIDLPTGGTGDIPLNNGNILIGNALNVAAPSFISKDATMNNLGQLTIANTAVTPIKIEPSTVNGQFLRTNALGNVVWDNLPTGTPGTVTSDGTTIIGDGLATALQVPLGGITTAQIFDGTIATADIANNAVTTIKILDDNVTPAKIAQGANGQILTTNGADVVWADPTAGNVNSDATLDGNGNLIPLSLANNAVTTIKILDDNVTPAKIAQGANGQILTTNGADVVWADPTAGNVNSDATLDGNGNLIPLSLANNAVTTIKILDDNVTPAKIEASATTGQILTTNGADVVWADPTAGNVNSDATLDGNGNLIPLSLANNAVTTIKILDDNVTPAKIAQGANGQILTTNGADVVWGNLTNPTETGSILFSNGTGGISENNALLNWDGSNFGIGVANPTAQLQVANQIRAGSFSGPDTGGSALNPTYRFNSTTKNDGMFQPDEDEIAFSAGGNEGLRIIANGNVGIGVTIPQANLHVAGDVRADGGFFSSDQTIDVPDYVFQKYFLGNSILNPNYEFTNLSEIEEFVKQNNHLPGIKSAAAIKEQGFWDLGEASRINLEKIEELFLHTIEQEKKIKELESSNKNMATEVEALKAQMEEIKKLLLEKTKE